MSPGPAPNLVSLSILVDYYPQRTAPRSFDYGLILDSPYPARDSKGSQNEEPERAPYRDREAKEESWYGHGETDGNGESTYGNHLVGGRPERWEAEESQPPKKSLRTIRGNHADASTPSTGISLPWDCRSDGRGPKELVKRPRRLQRLNIAGLMGRPEQRQEEDHGRFRPHRRTAAHAEDRP